MNDNDVSPPPAGALRVGATPLVVPHCRDEGVSLRSGDAVDTLAALPDASVDCVVTSPPYWGLRDYSIGGQYGQEPTADEYVDVLCAVFDQVARVLVDSGTLWLNVADSYGGSWGNYIAAGSGSVTARARACSTLGSRRPPQSRYRRKDLLGIPWRFALALVDRGWLMRNAVVWVKPNARPESVRDRLSQRYETLFLLTRSLDHFFATPAGSDDGDVWSIAAPRSRWPHIAVGPIELAARCIRHGCPPGGTVLDPFSGSGTTAVAARMAGNRFVGIDIDAANHSIAVRRLTERGLL